MFGKRGLYKTDHQNISVSSMSMFHLENSWTEENQPPLSSVSEGFPFSVGGFMLSVISKWNLNQDWHTYTYIHIAWYYPGEGNGNPLQYSCLKNPMDRGAWWAAVHGVAKSRDDWATSLLFFTFLQRRRKWQPTPIFLPGESQRQRSLVGCRLWGCTESDTTEAT